MHGGGRGKEGGGGARERGRRTGGSQADPGSTSLETQGFARNVSNGVLSLAAATPSVPVPPPPTPPAPSMENALQRDKMCRCFDTMRVNILEHFSASRLPRFISRRIGKNDLGI